MPYGFVQYNEILRLLNEFGFVLNDKEYERFNRRLVDILEV